MAPAIGRVVAELREYFTLERAEERARALPEDEARELRRDLILSIQKREAAELLFQGGARAEALRLAKEAWSLVARHAELAPDVKAPDDRCASSESSPLLDEDVRDEHVECFAALLAVQLACHRAFSPLVLDRAERKARSAARIGIAAVVLLLVLVLGVWWARRVELVAEASGSWGQKYAPANAVDGNEATHWLLPDKTAGYLDVKIVPPKRLSTVSLLTGYDPPLYGVVDYRVEAYAGNDLVKAVDGSMPPSGGVKPPWVDVAIGADRKIDRVRIVVKSFHDLGGSLAEVKVK